MSNYMKTKVDKPSYPQVGNKVIIINSDGSDGTKGKIKSRNNKDLAMVLWENNPIEDWVLESSLQWNGSKGRWELLSEV